MVVEKVNMQPATCKLLKVKPLRVNDRQPRRSKRVGSEEKGGLWSDRQWTNSLPRESGALSKSRQGRGT